MQEQNQSQDREIIRRGLFAIVKQVRESLDSFRLHYEAGFKGKVNYMGTKIKAEHLMDNHNIHSSSILREFQPVYNWIYKNNAIANYFSDDEITKIETDLSDAQDKLREAFFKASRKHGKPPFMEEVL